MTLAEWRQRRAVKEGAQAAPELLLLTKARFLSPMVYGLGTAEELQSLLSEKVESVPQWQQSALTLWLNVAAGQLNRQTEIQLADFPSLRRVEELLALFEEPSQQTANTALSAAAEQIISGEAIVNEVCAHMLMTQAGSDLYTSLRSASGFVFVSVSYSDNWVHRLHLYRFETGEQEVLVELPPRVEGRGATVPRDVRVSPVGDLMAYVYFAKSSSNEYLYSLNLYDFNAKQNREIVSGNLGYSQLVWSPDGETLAFTWSDPDQPPDIAMFPEAKEWLGNIWTYSVTLGEIAQQTFIEGAARWPAWSPDGKELAFVTHDGQIGAIELNSKGGPWQLQASIEGWLTYASVAYVP